MLLAIFCYDLGFVLRVFSLASLENIKFLNMMFNLSNVLICLAFIFSRKPIWSGEKQHFVISFFVNILVLCTGFVCESKYMWMYICGSFCFILHEQFKFSVLLPADFVPVWRGLVFSIVCVRYLTLLDIDLLVCEVIFLIILTKLFYCFCILTLYILSQMKSGKDVHLLSYVFYSIMIPLYLYEIGFNFESNLSLLVSLFRN